MERADIHNFNFQIEQKVQWGEMDALGHVNNVTFIRYFESARVNMFEQSGLHQTLFGQQVTILLAKIECNFLLPLYYPDTIKVMARIKTIGNTSLVVEHAVVSEKSGLVAFGDGVIVCTDPQTGIKTLITPDLRKALEKLM